MRTTAPAKLNLSLAIAGKMADGYHHLASLAMFAPDCADEVEITQKQNCHTSGAFADDVPTVAMDNLAWQALQLFADDCPVAAKLGVRLVKNLPARAGLASGSADAAAVVRLLVKQFPQVWSPQQQQQAMRKLGADVVACFQSSALWMTGRGDIIAPLSLTFNLWAVLVVPDFGFATKDVYHTLNASALCGEPDCPPPHLPDLKSLLAFLHDQPNALTSAATQLNPNLAALLVAIEHHAKDALLTRMSGSGSACFALFASPTQAQDTAKILTKEFPDYWVRASQLC